MWLLKNILYKIQYIKNIIIYIFDDNIIEILDYNIRKKRFYLYN